uniref:Uncharacterized protein n=1 Tax=Panagrolaimus sp. PS1159 TaxID=55785 RepID=A0AC35FHW4_9BILA
MGIYDILILPCNGIITGIQVILGQHFCNNPKLYFFMGVFGCDGYYGVTTLCVILAFDRFLEMCFPKFSPYIFGGWKTYLWMIVPILYQCFCGFQLSHAFNIKTYAMHHDPYHFIPGMENNPKMTIQALFICGEMFVAPVLHTLMLFWEFPAAVEIIAHISWICLHGDTPIIYFILNKSLRKAVIKKCSPIFKFPNSLIKSSKKVVVSLTQSSNRIDPYINNNIY